MSRFKYDPMSELEANQRLSSAEKAFIAEILEVCAKHGLSISHEDSHGAFEIAAYNDLDNVTLAQAYSIQPTQNPTAISPQSRE